MTAMEIVLSKLSLSAADDTITLALLEIEQKVRTFCNVPPEELLPDALSFTMANMTVDLLKNNPAADADLENIPVKSVTMGDTSYTFDIVSGRQLLDKIVLNYESDLLKFRRRRK